MLEEMRMCNVFQNFKFFLQISIIQLMKGPAALSSYILSYGLKNFCLFVVLLSFFNIYDFSLICIET